MATVLERLDAVKASIDELVDDAETTTGESYANISAAVAGLIAGFGQSSGDLKYDSGEYTIANGKAYTFTHNLNSRHYIWIAYVEVLPTSRTTSMVVNEFGICDPDGAGKNIAKSVWQSDWSISTSGTISASHTSSEAFGDDQYFTENKMAMTKTTYAPGQWKLIIIDVS